MAVRRARLAAWAALAGAALAASLPGCAATPPEPEKRVDEIELQEKIERFAKVLSSRIVQAADPLLSPSVPGPVRAAVTRQITLLLASVVDIASGLYPETNLLDML